MNILKLLRRPVAFHHCLAELCDSALAGLFLSQAIYWTGKTKDPEGWFYKTQEEWHAEIYLSRSEQEAARKKLKAYGYLEEKRVGLPAKIYYRVNLERLEAALLGKQAFSLEEILDLDSKNLQQLSKASFLRAKKMGVAAELVSYAEVLKTLGTKCGICGEPITKPTGKAGDCLTFSYLTPLTDGGTHTFANLQPAHVACVCNPKTPGYPATKSVYGKATKSAYGKQTGPLTVSRLVRLPKADYLYTETTSEITTEITSCISGESQDDSPLVAEGEILLEYPCREKKQVWHLTSKVLDQLQEVYPEIDCLAEAKKAKLWVEANPTRKKTKRGYQRFLLNWIASARNPAGRSNAAAPPPAQVNWETHPRKAELVNLYETHGPLMLSRSQFDLSEEELNLRRAFLTWYTSHEC